MVLSRQAALAKAMATTRNSPGTCQLVTRNWFGAPSAGDRDHDKDADAVDGWLSEPPAARHAGDRNPPAGVPLAFGGGSRGFGHRCMSRGGHNARSTDMNNGRYAAGVTGNATIEQIEKAMGVHYLGWSETITGQPIPNPQPAKEAKSVTLFIPDLSHYQFDSGFDLAQVPKQGYAAVILKCTQDNNWFDSTYVRALAKAQALKLRVAVYHFLERGHGAQQAEWLAKHIGDKELPVFIDVEPSTNSRPTDVDWVEFRTRATQLGLKVVGKYLTEAYWAEIGKPSLVGPLKLWRAAYPTMNHDYASRLYPGDKHARWNAFGGQTPTLWQFTSNAKFDGFGGGVDVSAFRGTVAQLDKTGMFKNYGATKAAPAKPAAPKPTVKPATPKPAPAPVQKPGKAVAFKLFLVPGNKKQTVAQVKADMALVNSIAGDSAVVVNTERETDVLRKAVADGLGKGWTTSFTNENVMATGSNWSPSPGLKPNAVLLNKADPHLAGVSGDRHLNELFQINRLMPGVTVGLLGTHLLSEANCVHVNVKGRAWREKNWPVQLNEVIAEVERLNKAGVPSVLAGDFNTGVKFTGDQVLALLKTRFGAGMVTHLHNGALDHIFLVSTAKVKLSEVGKEYAKNNASDHDMIVGTIRAEVR